MARLYRSNPIPTSGALFVTNPRRRRRRNAWHGEPERHKKAFLSSVYGQEQSRRLSEKWYGKTPVAELKTKTMRLLRKLYTTAPKSKHRKLLTETQAYKLVDAGVTQAEYNKLKQGVDGRSQSTARQKEAVDTLLARKGIIGSPKESTAKKGSSRRKRKSMKKNKEKGMLAFSNPRRRRRRNLRKRRKNGLALRRNAIKLNRRKKRKTTAKKGYWSKTKFKKALKAGKGMAAAHRAARKKTNPTRRKRKNAIKLNTRRRKNAVKINRRRKNSVYKMRRRRNQAKPLISVALGAVEDVQKKAKSFPIVSFLAFAITPVVLGAGVYYVHKAVEPILLPALKPLAKVPILGAALQNPYLTTGLVVGLGLNVLASTKVGRKVISQKVAAQIGGLAVAMGIGLDMSLKGFAQAAAQVAEEEAPKLAAQDVIAAQDAVAFEEGVAMDQLEAAAAVNGDLAGYGDGGFYAIGANSQDLGALASQYGALASEYGDAQSADAYLCSPVMHPSEVSAAVAGGPFWHKKFGRSPKRLKGQRTKQSRHAGRMGHRYGWLIKMIGFQNFQKIAALPASKRKQLIQSLRKKALAQGAAERQKAAQLSQMAESASMPIAGAANGPSGFSGVGYGALMFAGNGY